ncbi:hypothetical protein F5Y17DRAFT_466372 [Xylariaceae sp. FL0594]|nr:hypothetical protein F5Y17DRAFT_466372 [Xylariaceae sp. FL0594]
MEEPMGEDVPIVQYNKENKQIPGDNGWKMKECGNICHWTSRTRVRRFHETVRQLDFRKIRNPEISLVQSFLADLVRNGPETARTEGTVIKDSDNDLVISLTAHGLQVRVWQLKDVDCKDKESYRNAPRAKSTDKASTQLMEKTEPIMGRAVENLLMVQRIAQEKAPCMPMYRKTKANPLPRENRKPWYKEMRLGACRQFWLKTTREQRDEWREQAQNPPPELKSLTDQIKAEDKSHTVDSFWSYQRDEAAAAVESIYTTLTEHIIVVFDKNDQVVLCRFQSLFQFLYGEGTIKTMNSTIRQWSAMPALPLADNTRHMVDEYILQKHPELDLEKARTLKEIYKRHQWVVHYGTWAMKSRSNPDHIHLTPDTRFNRAQPRSHNVPVMPDVAFPAFRQRVMGLGSEVVRYLFRTIAPEEYQECCKVYKALPDTAKIELSKPTFSTLTIQTDVKFGFASLVALGEYTGGDLCFPQLGIKLPYQPGDCVTFRGAEMEHFVTDWHGNRIFLLYTNHQPVRNFAHRVMGKLPPKKYDTWHPEYRDTVVTRDGGGDDAIENDYFVVESSDGSDTDTASGRYSPCIMPCLSPEPEILEREDIHGPALYDDIASSESGGITCQILRNHNSGWCG